MDKVFEALASTPRRKILAYLSATELSAGEIASRFEMTKPSLSKHLRILETAGLIASEKRGQFVFYRIEGDNLAHTLASFLQAVCPVSQGLKKESRALVNKKNPASSEPL
jgi:ArsR family transcriptional regulator